ncbi:MAG: hypothetical protein QXX30_00930 [Candidatus Aenigmatarchaeota archaeon]
MEVKVKFNEKYNSLQNVFELNTNEEIENFINLIINLKKHKDLRIYSRDIKISKNQNLLTEKFNSEILPVSFNIEYLKGLLELEQNGIIKDEFIRNYIKVRSITSKWIDITKLDEIREYNLKYTYNIYVHTENTSNSIIKMKDDTYKIYIKGKVHKILNTTNILNILILSIEENNIKQSIQIMKYLLTKAEKRTNYKPLLQKSI